MRVCHLAYTFYESDNRVMRYAEALAERGQEVDVIALRRRGMPRVSVVRGVRVFRIQRRTVTEKGALTYLLKILWFLLKATAVLSVLQLRRRYDLVHVHNVPDFLVYAAWLPQAMGAKVILDIHDILPELYAGKFDSKAESPLFRALLHVERLSCRRADHVIVANDLWRERLVARAVAGEKCTTILNYPDFRVFATAATDPSGRNGTFRILYPGSLNRHQGVDLAIEALALVADRMPDAELHIYGEGPARPGLARLAEERGLTGRVKLMAPVPIAEVPALLAQANIGVVPKRADGFGNEAFSTKILEFMACGVPVIVSRTRVDTRYFTDAVVRFFAPGDPADLARVMLEVYGQRGNHEEWVRTAREFALRNSWDERVVEYLAVVDRLLAASSRRQPVAG